jgi:hypothetical protein
MMEMLTNPCKYRDYSKLEWYCWISPLVDSFVFGVGWAVPTFDR